MWLVFWSEILRIRIIRNGLLHGIGAAPAGLRQKNTSAAEPFDFIVTVPFRFAREDQPAVPMGRVPDRSGVLAVAWLRHQESD